MGQFIYRNCDSNLLPRISWNPNPLIRIHLMQTLSLPKTMRSVICYGPEDYRLEEIPVPQVQPGEVLVRVLGAGICAGDFKCFHGAPLFWGDEHRQGYCQPPITPGHEFVGEVVALGEGAAEKYGLALGDLGHLRADRALLGVPLLQARPVLDVRRQARCLRLPPAHPGRHGRIHALPRRCHQSQGAAALTTRQAVYIEPLACAIHAVQRGEHRVGRHGRGRRLRAAGPGDGGCRPAEEPRPLIALDLKPNRLEVARKAGADLTLNPQEVDVVAEVKKLTGGYGCDVYIEATGTLPAWCRACT